MTRRAVITALMAIFLSCLTGSVLQATPNHSIQFKRISLNEGLSQSVVNCILQDKKGFMWFGTQDGLNKYDGCRFTIYRPDPEKSNSISNNHILSIHEDQSGTLWVGTMGGGLNKFNREKEEFTWYKSKSNDPTTISQDIVRTIYEDSFGTLWVGTNAGLNKYNRETDSFKRYRHNYKDPGTISDNSILTITEDRQGNLWIGTRDGFNLFDRSKEKFVRYQRNPMETNTLSSNVVSSIFEDHSGEFWIGTWNGLNRFNRDTGKYTVYFHDPENPNTLSGNHIVDICEDHAGVLWICTTDSGINSFNRRHETFVHYRHDPTDDSSLASDVVSSICEDRSGALWIGTGADGISFFDRNKESFDLYQFDPNVPDSLSTNLIFGVYEDRDGVLWVATDGGGVNKLERETGKFVHYMKNPEIKGSLPSDSILSLYEDEKGGFWIGTRDAGLHKFDRDAGKVTASYNRQNKSAKNVPSNNTIRHISGFGDILWLGTRGGGLNKFIPETEQFTIYQHIPKDPNSLASDSVSYICNDPDGSLWLATPNGMEHFDPKTGHFKHFKSMAGNPQTLSSNTLTSIYRAPSGILWIGTFGGGFNKFDPKTGTAIQFREKHGLPNDVVYGILPDERGFLWLSTNKGLSRFDPRTETFKNYNVKDGLQSNEFNAGAHFKGSSGRLYFGGINGLTAFNPDAIKDNTFIPPVVITDFQIFNKPVSIGKNSPLKKHISEAKVITLNHNQNVFSFKFVALNYTIPEKNQYKYMMEGFDKDWIHTGAPNTTAVYTNLDPGQYTFRVKGSNNDGVWNETGASVKVVIVPPFWRTLWFRLSATILFLFLASLFFRQQMRNSRLKAELQSAQVAQMSIMPQSDPQIESFHISGVCVPAYEVGGDFFDYIWLDGEKKKLGVAIGDVSGKAMKAAMTAVLSSGMLYSKIDGVSSVKEIMTQVNRPLFSKTDKRMFTALCLASLDTVSKEFIFSNAGLNEPLLKTAGGTAYIPGTGSRAPLGSFENNTYQETSLKLNPNDIVVLFTDGISEALNTKGEFYGYDALKTLITDLDTDSLSPDQIKQLIIGDVRKFSGGMPQQDDMTVVVIKYMAG